MPYGIACPVSSSAKLWSRTATGSPFGRHSRPACAYSPTCSFFLASTLITGCPAARCSLACAAMYRNWASRSGCRLPSVTFALACVLNPCSCSSRQAVCGLHRCPCRVSSSDSFFVLLVVHDSGDSGSPREESSTRASSAGTSPGSAWASFLRPAPGRRTRPPEANAPEASSAAPSATVCHDAPVTFATAVTPPSPAARATAPSVSRRAFSSSSGSSSSSSAPTSFTSSAFALIPASWHATRRKLRLFRSAHPGARMLPEGPFLPVICGAPGREGRRGGRGERGPGPGGGGAGRGPGPGGGGGRGGGAGRGGAYGGPVMAGGPGLPGYLARSAGAGRRRPGWPRRPGGLAAAGHAVTVASITRRRTNLAGPLGDLSKTPLPGRQGHPSAGWARSGAPLITHAPQAPQRGRRGA